MVGSFFIRIALAQPQYTIAFRLRAPRLCGENCPLVGSLLPPAPDPASTASRIQAFTRLLFHGFWPLVEIQACLLLYSPTGCCGLVTPQTESTRGWEPIECCAFSQLRRSF